MRNKSIVFQMFSDESGVPSKRFQSVSVVSGNADNCEKLRDKLIKILHKSGLKEMKWKDINGHRPRMEVADKSIDIAIKYSKQQKIRIDVLYWDLEDSRHAILGRDDIANLERMYYKVIKHLIYCWNKPEAMWELFPDEGSDLKWDKIIEYVKNTNINRPYMHIPLSSFVEEPNQESFKNPNDYTNSNFTPHIGRVYPTESHKEPLIQLADLFAGIARFSKEKGEEFFKWLETEEAKRQKRLFILDEESDITESRRSIARFTILRKLYGVCKRNKMQVSFKTNKYLITMSPCKPINFWFYIPQVEEDKAPIKKYRWII